MIVIASDDEILTVLCPNLMKSNMYCRFVACEKMQWTCLCRHSSATEPLCILHFLPEDSPSEGITLFSSFPPPNWLNLVVSKTQQTRFPLRTMSRWTTKLPTGSNKVALLYSQRTIESVIAPSVHPPCHAQCTAKARLPPTAPPPPTLSALIAQPPLVSRLKSRIIFGREYSQMGTFRWIALSHVLPHVCVLCLV